MWASDTMTLGESLIISATGLTVVVAALLLLALTTVVFSKNLALLGLTGDSSVKAVLDKGGASLNEEEYAVLISAISEEANGSLDKYRIKEIKEV